MKKKRTLAKKVDVNGFFESLYNRFKIKPVVRICSEIAVAIEIANRYIKCVVVRVEGRLA